LFKPSLRVHSMRGRATAASDDMLVGPDHDWGKLMADAGIKGSWRRLPEQDGIKLIRDR
jgi:hypothetical protein